MRDFKKAVRVGVVKKDYGQWSEVIHGGSVVLIYGKVQDRYECAFMAMIAYIPVELVDIVTEPAFARAMMDFQSAYERVVHHQNQFLGYEDYPDYPSEDWVIPFVWIQERDAPED